MPELTLHAPFEPTGDQPQAIAGLVEGLTDGMRHQVLLGATGTGKTFVMAQIVQEIQRPTLVMAHNKTLAAQLYAEFKSFFPNNAVEYFVSYYDYYQPEAYVPKTDLYIEKDSSINDEIERLPERFFGGKTKDARRRGIPENNPTVRACSDYPVRRGLHECLNI